MDQAAGNAVTRQYLAGELSLRLARLQAAMSESERAQEVARLRHEAETVPVSALGCVMSRALAVTDEICFDSMDRGNWAVFIVEATICSELWEFGVCAGLLTEPGLKGPGGRHE